MSTTTWELETSEQYGNRDLRLVELSPEMENAIKEGQKLYFCGGDSQQAVLCTENKSYRMVGDASSNTSILFEHSMIENTTTNKENTSTILLQGCTVAPYYQLTEKTPDSKAVEDLLLQHPYDPTTVDMAPRYTIQMLSEKFQQSENEMIQILDKIHAFSYNNGSWMILDALILSQIFSSIIDMIIEKDWDITSIVTCEQFAHEIDHMPKIVLEQCLKIHCDEEKSDIKTGTYILSPPKVAEFRAHQIFKEQDMQLTLGDFINKWSLCLPDGIENDLSYLKGIALLNGSREEENTTLSYFPEHHLPLTPSDRFEELFAFRSQWLLADIEPYLNPLVNGTTTTTMSLLLKHARSHHNTNTEEYSFTARK